VRPRTRVNWLIWLGLILSWPAVSSAQRVWQPPLRRISQPEMRSFSALVERSQVGQPLRGMRLLGVQHLLGSTGGLLRAFSTSGMRPEHMIVLGKTYSQHDGVIRDLRLDGYGVFPSEVEPGLDARLAGVRRQEMARGGRIAELERAVAQLRASEAATPGAKRERILVIDDGGELIELIHYQHPELHDRIVAVEQTTRGLKRIAGLSLRFPVISVAGSEAKREHESPMIGASIAKSTLEKLGELSASGVRVGSSTLVIGYGAVGRATAAALARAGRKVAIYDRSEAARKEAGAPPGRFQVYDRLEDALPHAAVVVSTTGETPVTETHLRLLPDWAVLINGASSSTEFRPDQTRFSSYYSLRFSPNKLVQMVRGRTVAEDERAAMERGTMRARRDWVFELAHNRRIVVPNQGTVINFDGSADPIPPRYIQLTRGLLYLAALQAAQLPAGARGVIELDGAAQRTWVEEVRAELRSTSESLAEPRF
jgi:S-adenosylhomocysteine hydrolase